MELSGLFDNNHCVTCHLLHNKCMFKSLCMKKTVQYTLNVYWWLVKEFLALNKTNSNLNICFALYMLFIVEHISECCIVTWRIYVPFVLSQAWQLCHLESLLLLGQTKMSSVLNTMKERLYMYIFTIVNQREEIGLFINQF
jgi:hypothetical protein